MKDSYYFSHDSNAKDDPKCVLLIEQLGLEGYGIFWVLIETLRDQPSYRYPLKLVGAIARRFNTTSEKVKTVILNYDLFMVEDDEFFYSASLIRRMELHDRIKKSKSLAAKKGNEARWGKLSHSDHKAIAATSQSNDNAVADPSRSDRTAVASSSHNDHKTIADPSRNDRTAIAPSSQSDHKTIADLSHSDHTAITPSSQSDHKTIAELSGCIARIGEDRIGEDRIREDKRGEREEILTPLDEFLKKNKILNHENSEFLASQKWFDDKAMQLSVQTVDLIEKAKDFLVDLRLHDKIEGKELADLRTHFISWYRLKRSREPTQKPVEYRIPKFTKL